MDIVVLSTASEQEGYPSPTPRTRRLGTTPPGVPSGSFVLDLLKRIEGTPGTCAITFTHPDERPLGELLFSGGQVCMITLAHGQVPLGARLRQRDPAVADAVHTALIQARTDRRPLGDVLASLGAVQSSSIREALLDQFADSLSALGHAAPGGLEEAVQSAPQRRLSTVLSAFPATEIYWRTVAVLAPRVADAASACFDELAAKSELAVLVARAPEAGGAPLVVAARGFEPRKVAEIARLGWLVEQTVCRPALLAADQEPQFVLFGESEDSVLGVVTPRQLALITGLGAETRARTISRLRHLIGPVT